MSFARILACLVFLFALPAAAQSELTDALKDPIPAIHEQMQGFLRSAIRLPLAALLGAALAFRPRRRGTPPRQPTVIQTQILLAVVGALVMLIVGQSLARAFGIVGVASLVRYRAKVDDPKDAGVMLANLGIGLASGVGLYMIAAFATVFLLGFLWWVESFEPRARKRFHLNISAPSPEELRGRLEALLERHRAKFDLRSISGEEISYEVRLPYDDGTEELSTAITSFGEPGKIAVEWDEKKKKA
jgi:uncharacterized membrane protein YhiD involved in acid resistance